MPRRQVRVGSLTASAGVPPFLVGSLELVTETHFLRRSITQRGIVDLYFFCERRKLRVRLDGVFCAARGNPFNLHRRWQPILRKSRGIYYSDAIKYGEPQTPILRLGSTSEITCGR